MNQLDNKYTGPTFNKDYDVDWRSALGSGGAANVYKCIRKSDGCEFAIKLLDDKTHEKITRFRDEINVMRTCASNGIEGIMPIIDFNIGECWYVMPIAKSMSDEIKEWKQKIKDAVPQGMSNHDIVVCAVKAFYDIANTLSDVHKLGYTHRDIKPKNLYCLDGKYVIGDFGIVDIPDGDHRTKKGDKLGAWNTIAPEVLRDASKATPAADVYSIAKTLWMYLASNEDGFDGRYDVEYSSISLHDIRQYRGMYLVEIDDLLHDATQEEPERRPTMDGFIHSLKSWEVSDSNPKQRNKHEWNFIYEILFRGMKPTHTELVVREDIAKTLNALSRYGVLNYSMLPTRGGLQLKGASVAPEEGCIYLDYGYLVVCRPKRLVIRSFVGDELWNYFYLEFDNIDNILSDEVCELLVEDTPGHYVDASNWVYRVYDYDTREPLPVGAKRVERYCRGAILFVASKSIYNSITPTDDGRHADCSEVAFYDYICSMRNDYHEIANKEDDDHFYNKYSTNPFKLERSWGEDLPEMDSSHDYNLIKDYYEELDFSDLLVGEIDAPAKYCFYLELNEHIDIFDFGQKHYYLCRDGKIKKLEKDSEEIYYAYGKDNAIGLHKTITDRLKEFSEAHGQNLDIIDGYFTPSISLVRIPDHVFNYRELRDAIREANDRHDNYIVIDENGFANVVEDYGEFYPVRTHLLGAYNDYVGWHSDGKFADEIIHGFLASWLSYLETGNTSEDIHSKYDKLSNKELKDKITNLVHQANE